MTVNATVFRSVVAAFRVAPKAQRPYPSPILVSCGPRLTSFGYPCGSAASASMPWVSSSFRRDSLTSFWTTSSVICTLAKKGAGGVVKRSHCH